MRILHYTSRMENPDDETENPQDTTEPTNTAAESEDSLGNWIDRAKRAHELVDAVDLDKVAAHDPVELNKLGTVSQALNDLGRGKEIERVEGVDEVMPEIDEDQQRKAILFSDIASAGWVERMGRILCVDEEGTHVKPLELIPHKEGLPEFDICIAPEQRLSRGNYGLFISSHGIFAASISEPVSKHHWRIDRSRPYEADEELHKSIAQFSQNDE
jgi:hypothetical protein